MRVVFGSTNTGKCEEVSRWATKFSRKEIISLQRVQLERKLGAYPQVAEIELTYEGNARLKALAYAQWCLLPVVTDDTGLEIDCLGALPGVHTARFGLSRLCSMLVPEVAYAARFVCSMCYAEPQGRVVAVTVGLPGVFRSPRNVVAPDSSLPFSYFFTPRGESRSLADLRHDSTFRSHRGMAIETLFRSLF